MMFPVFIMIRVMFLKIDLFNGILFRSIAFSNNSMPKPKKAQNEMLGSSYFDCPRLTGFTIMADD